MAVLSTTHPTLLDFTKRLDPGGNIDAVAELLNQFNPILDDMVWVEGNLPTGHRSTIRTGLPNSTWRKLYQGVQPSRSTTVQITDNTAMLEAYGEVDKALADLNGNTAAFRMSEEMAQIESMSQEMATALFYADEGVAPEKFTGLAPRFNSLSAGNAGNIIDAGGVGTDNTSIWLVGWGPNSVHGIIPKGSVAGLQVEDKGQVTIESIDGAGGRMEAYRTHYRWDCGLTLRDWRFVVRIANISKAALRFDAATGPNLNDLLFTATERMQSFEGVRAVLYMSRNTITFLRKQSSNAVKNSVLTVENLGGIPIVSFNGVPIKRVDVLAADEARVV